MGPEVNAGVKAWYNESSSPFAQPFQNSAFRCFQQLQRLPWDCQTLENPAKTKGSSSRYDEGVDLVAFSGEVDLPGP
jgi:hypothetical protein